MRRAGRRSWRLSEDVGQIPHALLFVRDALDLPVEPGIGIPPALAHDVPRRSDLLGVTARPEAARGWATWWNAVIGVEARRNLGSTGDPGRWIRGCAEELCRLIDPPAWSSLADRPALREAARTLFEEGCRWADTWRQPVLPPAHEGFFEWRLIRDTAKTVAAEAGVGIGAINGCVLMLLVESSWWEVASPGVVLCSPAAAEDPAIAQTVLRRAFASALTD